MGEAQPEDREGTANPSSRRSFLKLGLYVAPAVIAVNYFGSSAHAAANSDGGSEHSGGGTENPGGGSENSGGGENGGGEHAGGGAHGADVSAVAHQDFATGREHGSAVSDAAKNKP
jgi:hypothetical protein